MNRVGGSGDEGGSAVLDGHAASRMTPSLNRSIHSRSGGRASTGNCAATAWNSTRATGAPFTIAAISRGGKRQRPRLNSVIVPGRAPVDRRAAEHTSELQTLTRTTYAIFCLNKQRRVQATSLITLLQKK